MSTSSKASRKRFRSKSRSKGTSRALVVRAATAAAQRGYVIAKGGLARTRGIVPLFKRADPFPLHKFYKLRYTGLYQLTIGATGTFGTMQSMRLNSLFDPDLTGSGHQPYGYDQIAAVYNRYKVYGAKVVSRTFAPSNQVIAVGAIVTTPSDSSDTIASLDIQTVQEKNNCALWYLTNTGNQRVTKTQYFKMHQVMGITKAQFTTDLDNTTAAIGGNPGDACYISFAACSPNAGESSKTVFIEIDITYSVMLYDRKTLAQS